MPSRVKQCMEILARIWACIQRKAGDALTVALAHCRTCAASFRGVTWKGKRAEGWLQVAAWLLVVNLLHLAAIVLLRESASIGQATDAARALSAQPFRSWVVQAVLPAILATLLIALSTSALGVVGLRRLNAIAATHSLRTRRVGVVAVVLVPTALALLSALVANAWMSGNADNAVHRVPLFLATLGLMGFATWRLCLWLFRRSVSERQDEAPSVNVRVAYVVLGIDGLLVCGLFLVGSDAEVARELGLLGTLRVGLLAWSIILTACFVSIPLLINRLPVNLAWFACLALIGVQTADPHRLVVKVSGEQSTRQQSTYPDAEAALYQWLRARENEDATAPIPVIMVAADGGGIRAAYWAARMLALINRETGGSLAKYTFAYSGVSGGSLGIATFADLAINRQLTPQQSLELIDDFYRQDLLSPVVARLLTVEPLRYVTGSSRIAGRDTVFEAMIAGDWRRITQSPSFDAPFPDVFAPTPKRLMPPPLLIFNATVAETGKRLEISNVQRIEPRSLATRYFEPNDLLTVPQLTLAQAVHLSARFPGISPPAAIYAEVCESNRRRDSGDDCKRRVQHWLTAVDGGYHDNSGIAPIQNVLSVLARERSAVDALLADPARMAAASAEVLANARLLSRVSFHVIVLSNSPEMEIDPFNWPSCAAKPTSDIQAAASALEKARQQRALESLQSLTSDIQQLRRESRQGATAGCRVDIAPYQVPIASVTRRAGCRRIPDSILTQDIRRTLPVALSTTRTECPALPVLTRLPLGWSLSADARATLATASDRAITERRFNIVRRLGEYWPSSTPTNLQPSAP